MALSELKVPSVGESITEVQIGDWLVGEGASAGKDDALVVIETADGLPVRTLEVNDLGVVQTRLGARPHRLHVIERGRKSRSTPFTVDSDPYFLDVDP